MSSKNSSGEQKAKNRSDNRELNRNETASSSFSRSESKNLNKRASESSISRDSDAKIRKINSSNNNQKQIINNHIGSNRISQSEQNDPTLDFFSESFDPLRALIEIKTLPSSLPNVRPLDFLSKCKFLLPTEDVNYIPLKAKKSKEELLEGSAKAIKGSLTKIKGLVDSNNVFL